MNATAITGTRFTFLVGNPHIVIKKNMFLDVLHLIYAARALNEEDFYVEGLLELYRPMRLSMVKALFAMFDDVKVTLCARPTAAVCAELRDPRLNGDEQGRFYERWVVDNVTSDGMYMPNPFVNS